MAFLNALPLHLCSWMQRPSDRLGWLILLLLGFCLGLEPAQAEGSRTLYPATAPTNARRANLEWRTNVYGNIVLRRTLLKVFVQQGEHILLGSSAVGVNNGDILVYQPGRVTGNVGSESIPTNPDFRCSNQNDIPNRGRITSRALELTGPRSVNSNANTSGYLPCYYQAPFTGIYDVVFYGPSGSNSGADGTVTSELNLTSSNNFNATQGSSVSAWDVTVRSSDPSSSNDLNGRLFSYYYALFTAGNGRPLYFSIYPVTTDGYQYEIRLNGLDPNGFVLYGNQVGFWDSDGKTPLYKNVIGQDAGISNPDGNVSLARPQYATFFNPIDPAVLSYIERFNPDGSVEAQGIPLSPILPTVSGLSFTGTAGGNSSQFQTGGSFSFNTNIEGTYELIISRNGTDFNPENPQNRRLRGLMTVSGAQSISWDGRDNAGTSFPIGNNYPVQVRVRAGEYHFPMLDAENNIDGGPRIRLLNGSNPLGNTMGFYDDRGYTTLAGVNVGTPGQPLCGTNPPAIIASNPISGFDTTTNQRAFGLASGGNTNVKCTGAFGDAKALDLWTYVPSSAENTTVNIVGVGSPNVLLVKRITAINRVPLGQGISGQTIDLNLVVDDPASTQDNYQNWPSGLLKGAVEGGVVKPEDELEYTIYFINSGTNAAANLLLCDRIPDNVTFVPTAFNGQTIAAGSLTMGDRGILLNRGGTVEALSNIVDGDIGHYLPPGTSIVDTYPQLSNCGTNTNGAIVVNLGTLQKAESPGLPTTSYGWIRFRGRIK